jgi:sulfite reductase (NADPH) flavoprotein alpha-component
VYSDLNPLEPLALEQLNNVTQAIQGFSPQQKMWLSGYLAGLSTHETSIVSDKTTDIQLSILYGSQTGNCRLLAEKFADTCQSKGFSFQLTSLSEYKPRNISKEKYLVIIVSTHGEGEAPDDAALFYEYLFSDKNPNLKNLEYSVLALGDSSYEKYCQTGVDIDNQLKKLGAKSIINRVDCDLDYQELADKWQLETIEHFGNILAKSENNITPLSLIKPYSKNSYNRNNTYSSEILSLQKITTQNSVKNVYHIELNIEDSSITYQVGDSLGVVAQNSESKINDFIKNNNFDPHKLLNHKEQSTEFKQVLMNLEISLINKSFLKFYADLGHSDKLKEIVDDHQKFIAYVSKRQVMDLLTEFPTNITEQQLIDNLVKITPRLYSIASSYINNPDELHLTIALVESSSVSPSHGLVSGLLCNQAAEGDQIQVYVEKNDHFKLPKNNDTPIIMIGAGTGIAPFRGFLQERKHLNAQGDNWLFFGNPSFENDFLYQLEIQNYYKDKTLKRIDLAFSRDQDQKIYVQDRIKQQAQDIWQWLEKGAHLYICGNKDFMAKEVEAELICLIEKFGNKSTEQAHNYLKILKLNKRYQKDVY